MNIKLIIGNAEEYIDNKPIKICGWVNNSRIQSNIGFISLNDGSCHTSIQVVFDINESEKEEYDDLLSNITKGASLEIIGNLKSSPAKGQKYELKTELHNILLHGKVDVSTYPISKKKHSMEFIRQYPHLRVKTNTFGTVARIRNTCSIATHKFFQSKNFLYVHTPIITSNDCEGAGETFTVTNILDDKVSNIPIKKNSDSIDIQNDFFSKRAHLTVSGQLHVESYAMGLSNVYTFGPTFRAEKSTGSRHLAEFWMIEPEISFCTFEELLCLAEDYIKFCISEVLEQNNDDINFINKFILKGHRETLENIAKSKFKRITYTEAVNILQKDFTKKSKYPKMEKWGDDLSSEQEKYLTYKFGPTIVYDYPKEIKSFYMKINEDGKTVQAMDILVPGIGELIGGSMREDDYEKLLNIITKNGLEVEKLSWYLDLRKYGSAPHGGFGLGFERLIMLITGLSNIKDCIPFPRYPGHCIY